MCLNYDGLNRDKDTPILLLKVLNQEKTIKVRCFNLLQITKKHLFGGIVEYKIKIKLVFK